MVMARFTVLLLAATLASAGTFADSPTVAGKDGATDQPTPRQAAAAWRLNRGLYFKRNWGVEIIGVKPVSAGYMLAFRYRVLDPNKARVLNDRKTKAYLVDDATGITLAVPALENIGELRTGAAMEVDRSYFIVFGNPGKLVKSGSRVTLVAGALQVDGLIVD